MTQPVWRCTACGHEEPFRELYACPRCSGELSLEYDYESLRQDRALRAAWGHGNNLWERFAPLLPPLDPQMVVTLGEGNTPLIRASRLARRLGLKNLYLKLELCNPTGSFKDRQISIAFSVALSWGHRDFAIASSGNAGVSLAAFCARAGCRANVWVSQGTPPSKLYQIEVYGARLFLLPDPTVTGNMARYYEAYTKMAQLCSVLRLVPMITARRVNPLTVEGGKTIAYEVVLQLGRVPDKIFLPIGGGGLCGSTWKGFEELRRAGFTDRVPQLFGAQYGGDQYLAIDRIGAVDIEAYKYYVPLDGAWARESIAASEGYYLGKVDHRLDEAQAVLASLEGVFAEPAGVAAVAGLMEAIDRGLVKPGDWIVCYVTGHGLKDTAVIERLCRSQSLGQRIVLEDFSSSVLYFANHQQAPKSLGGGS